MIEKMREQTKAIREKAQGQWDSILYRLAPTLRPAIDAKGKHVPCPVHGGTDGFRVFKEVADEGRTVCNTCGHFTDGFDTLMWANGWTFRTAIVEVGKYLGFDMGDKTQSTTPKHAVRTPPPIPKKGNERTDDEIRASLTNAWKKSVPGSHHSAEPIRLYMARRGLSTKVPDSLRFISSMAYWEDGKKVGDFPCMIALFESEDGAPVTIHRTYLTPDGRKANVSSPRKLMEHPSARKMAGGAFRMFPSGRVLGTGEGIETLLACHEVYGIPVWPALNAHLLENWNPPDDVERVIVFADKDRPSPQHPKGHGQEAARNLVLRLWEKGIQATAICPAQPIPDGAKGIDWLNVYDQFGAEAFPSLGSLDGAGRKAA